MLLYKWLWNCVFYFSKKMGQSGDGKRNIVWGWPNHLKTKAQVEYPLNCFIKKAKMMLNFPVLAPRLWRYFTVVFRWSSMLLQFQPVRVSFVVISSVLCHATRPCCLFGFYPNHPSLKSLTLSYTFTVLFFLVSRSSVTAKQEQSILHLTKGTVKFRK